MISRAYSLSDEWGEEHRHQPEGRACEHCGAPVDSKGEHLEPSTFDAVEAVHHLMLLLWDSPQQAFALAGAMLQQPGTEVARRMKLLTGKTSTRQNAYDLRLKLRAKYPELSALLFERGGDTLNTRHENRKRRRAAPGLCKSCGNISTGDYCPKCTPETAPKPHRVKGAFYPG